MQHHSPSKRFIYKELERISGKRHCTTISCSEGEHQETLRLTKDATYVSNGINIGELQRIIDSIDEAKPHPFTVFTLGRVCYQKNPKLFNDIAMALPDVKFVWIGGGGGKLKNELSAPNVEITGWVERENALQYSMNGDIFVLTSLWEGLPISLLEAMYMRKICIVSDVIGNRDVIHNEVNGFVCNDVDGFVKAIKKVQNCDVSKLVEAAYNDILTQYNTSVMADKYSEIYMEKYNGSASSFKGGR
jgi:glycosyltransferase involved in cell wall biosynthesis